MLIIFLYLSLPIQAQSRGRIRYNSRSSSTTTDNSLTTHSTASRQRRPLVQDVVQVSSTVRSNRISSLRTTRSASSRQPFAVTVRPALKSRTSRNDVGEEEFLMLAPSNRVETQENSITIENIPFTPKRVSTKYKTTEGPTTNDDLVQSVTKSFSSRYRQPEQDNTTQRTRINVAMFRGSVKKPKAQNNDIEEENYPEEFKQRLKAKVNVFEAPVEAATKPRDISVEKEVSTDAPTVVRRKVKKLRKVIRTTSTQEPTTKQSASTVTFRTLLRRTTTTESIPNSTEKSSESPLEMSRNRKRLYTPREFSRTDDTESPKKSYRFRPKSTTSSYTATIPVLGTVKPFIRRREKTYFKGSNEIMLDEAESVSRAQPVVSG